MRLGMICRMDRSGLGQGQTLRLAKLLNPYRVMLIDSTPFNGAEQFPEWYKGFPTAHQTGFVKGFPTDLQVAMFLQSLDAVISCETFYNNRFTTIAKSMGVKTILVANPEFFDWFQPNWFVLPQPDKVVVPSEWMMDKMVQFNAEYIPTPIFEEDFIEAREVNLERRGQRKYLFMNGKTAVHDRNGLESLYAAMQLAKGDFTVTIKAQHDVKKHPDPRILYDFTNPVNQGDLYRDFDALILPRRYGGQSLPMNEALMSGLPVIMTDIDPNNKVLPEVWLIPATKTGEFMTRTMIDIYSADASELAFILDMFADGRVFGPREMYYQKYKAFKIGLQFEAESLRAKYIELIKETIK